MHQIGCQIGSRNNVETTDTHPDAVTVTDAALTLSLSLTLALSLTLSRPRSPIDVECAYLVAEVGLEPTRPCGHRILNPARLPIPPLGQRSGDYSRTVSRRIPPRLVVDWRVR